MMDTDVRQSTPNQRRALGLFIARTLGQYDTALWSGAAGFAREHGLKLLTVVGGGLQGAGPGFEPQRNVLYELSEAGQFDGLVIAGHIGHDITPEAFRTFCERYRPLPLAMTAANLEGIPSVVVDNTAGLRAAITHLIEAHGYRRIACVRGSDGDWDAEERYRIYTEVLVEHGLPFDPQLVAPGNFQSSDGQPAVELLLDQRQLELDAIVCANDLTALGVIETLSARGLQVPDDIAVVGFDDITESRYFLSPLTTVHQPLYEIGWRAAELVWRQICGETIPARVVLPTALVLRQSCGCLFETTRHAVAGLWDAPHASTELATMLTQRRAELLAMLVPALQEQWPSFAPAWAAQLLDAFAVELEGQAHGRFVQELQGLARPSLLGGMDVNTWQRLASTLRRQLLPYLLNRNQMLAAEDIWHQARVLLSELAQWIEVYHQQQEVLQATQLRRISQALISSFEVPALMEVVVHELPRLGIASCALALYGDPQAPHDMASLILAYDRRGRIELPAEGLPFAATELAPHEVWRDGRPDGMVLHALYFQQQQLGYVLFEIAPNGGEIAEILRGQISSALMGALLMAQEKRALAEVAHSAARTHAQEEIIEAQKAIVRELSTPLIPITDRVMVMPLIGTIDSTRAQQIMETLLASLAAHDTQVVILDITGVSIIDTMVANALIEAARAARLLGGQVMLTGIRPEVAQTLVGLGVDLRGIRTHSTLDRGIAAALRAR